MNTLPDLYQDDENNEANSSTMMGMSMEEFMKRTSIYEHKSVPFSPLLRRAARVGMLFTLVTVVVILLLPKLFSYLKMLEIAPFGGFNESLNSYLTWLAHNPFVATGEGAIVVSGLVLPIFTKNLREGNSGQQWLAFIQAISGTGNFMLLAIPVAMLAANLLFWVVVTLLIAFFIITTLFALRTLL